VKKTPGTKKKPEAKKNSGEKKKPEGAPF